MAMKRGFCTGTGCNNREEVRRIFEVNSEAQFCYCPYCGKKYRPKVAIFNYEKRITKYNKKAKFFLMNVGEPLYAYNLFAYVLELESWNRTAKLGRLLSLAYLSTLRRNRFNEVRVLLELARDDVKETKTMANKYSNFLDNLNECASEYIDRVRKKLTFRNYFYNGDCLKLFFVNLRDTITLKRFLAGEYSANGDKREAQKTFDEIKKLELAYNEVIYTVDGIDHSFTNFTKAGDPLISQGRKRIDTKLSKFRMSTLDKNDKKLIYIKDTVFSTTFIRIYHLYDKAYVFSIINGAIGIGCMAAWLSLLKMKIAPLFLALFIFFTVLGLSFIALRIIFGYILKKPRK